MTRGGSTRASRRRSIVAAVGALSIGTVLALTACSSEASGAESASVPDPSELVGRWVTGMSYDSPTVPFLLIAEDGTWSGSDGCNGVQGEWSIGTDGALDVSSGPQTRMYCDGVALPMLFADAVQASMDGGRLRFFDAEGVTTVKLARSTSTEAPTVAPDPDGED